ncbi:hypothetical protein Q7P37_004141 [Cladosporium fusiforme]
MDTLTQNHSQAGAAVNRHQTRSATAAARAAAAAAAAPRIAPAQAAPATIAHGANEALVAPENHQPRLTLHLNARQRDLALYAAGVLISVWMALDRHILDRAEEDQWAYASDGEVRRLLDIAYEAIGTFMDVRHPGQDAKDEFNIGFLGFQLSLSCIVLDDDMMDVDREPTEGGN